MDDLKASRLSEEQYDQSQQQVEAQQEQLVSILKAVDMGTADHSDVLALAAALGLSKFFAH